MNNNTEYKSGGYAFSENYADIVAKHQEILNGVAQWRDSITFTKQSNYGRNTFKGTVDTLEALENLSAKDIALMVDSNHCFGAYCTLYTDGSFSGSVYTD